MEKETVVALFQLIMDVLDKADKNYLLDICCEPPISVIDRELDIAGKVYKIRRNQI